MTSLSEINRRFNEQLRRQASGILPAGHIYRLGRPGGILQSAGIPDLPIEMASARLLHKSNQENHPFGLSEVENLPQAIQNPLAVFRSATHIGSNVILTELKQGDKNFVVAIQTNRQEGKVLVNSVRSLHPRHTTNIVYWINEGLMDYAHKEKLQRWLQEKKEPRNFLNSSIPADVKKSIDSAAMIVENFNNSEIDELNPQIKRKHGWKL